MAFGAPLAKRFGPVPVLRLGMALEVIGVLWLALIISVDVTGWAMAPGCSSMVLGRLRDRPVGGVILSEVPIAESGQASAVQSTSRQVGAAIGTALLGAVLITGFGGIKGDLTDLGVSEEAAVQVTTSVQQSAGTAVVALPQQPDGDVLFKGASEGFRHRSPGCRVRGCRSDFAGPAGGVLPAPECGAN